MSTVEHPIRGPLNAFIIHRLDDYMHAKLGPLKARLFADLPSTVVELGAGTGANMRYLRPGTRLLAVEPNRHMHAPLRAAAARHDITLELRDLSDDRLPFPDASVDAIICTLVLCTVPDPTLVLSEVRRVLRPGGRFLCIEHVAAEPGALRVVQRTIRRPWRWFFEGCDTCRDTESLLRAAGFTSLTVERHTVPSVFVPIRRQISATAIR
jgi:SAM-dependent methyltransferase